MITPSGSSKHSSLQLCIVTNLQSRNLESVNTKGLCFKFHCISLQDESNLPTESPFFFLRLLQETAGTAFSTWSSKTRAALRESAPCPGGAFLVTSWPLWKYRLETCNPHRATSAQQVQGFRPRRRSVILRSPRLGLGTGLTTLSCKGHMPQRPSGA